MIFDLFLAPEQKKVGGAPGAPPAPGKASRTSPLGGLSDSLNFFENNGLQGTFWPLKGLFGLWIAKFTFLLV